MSALLCGAMLFGCAVYAEGEGETGAETPVTPEKAVVSIAADKTEVRVGESLKITVTVDNLQDNLKTADITLRSRYRRVCLHLKAPLTLQTKHLQKDKITKKKLKLLQQTRLLRKQKKLNFQLTRYLLKTRQMWKWSTKGRRYNGNA